MFISGYFHVLGIWKPHFQCNANREVATTSYNGKVLVVRLNNAVFSYLRSSYVSSIIDVARTVFTKAKFAWPPYQRLLLSAISILRTHIFNFIFILLEKSANTANITHQRKWCSNKGWLSAWGWPQRYISNTIKYWLKYHYIIKSQYALTVRYYCMLNYLWVVTVFAKRLLTNAFFLFRKDSCYSQQMVTFPRISKLRLLRDVNFVGKAES